MRTALDHANFFLPVEVDVSMYPNQSISTKERRFTCPICGEYVYLDKRGRFGHKNKSDEMNYCERRTGLTGQAYSLSYRVGLPIYIKKKSKVSNSYILTIGFSSIPNNVIKSYPEVKITISDSMNPQSKVSYQLNRFLEKETCQLDFIPENNKNYDIDLSDCPKELNCYLSNYADGFINGRAIFTYHSGEGRKIHKGDTIETNTDYILVSADSIEEILGMVSERIGELINTTAQYCVYRIRFEPSNRDVFQRLIYFCQDNFRITLVEKKPELIPLWPPTIQKNNNYEIITNQNEVYTAVLPINAKPKIYRHYGFEFAECVMISSNFINFVKVKCNIPCIVTISKAYSLDSFGFRKEKYQDFDYYIGHEPIFKNVRADATTIYLTENDREIEYLIMKGYILTCIYPERTIDYNYSDECIKETRNLRYIVISRNSVGKRIPIKKYTIQREEKEQDTHFDFMTNPLIGYLVPVTPQILNFLKKHYNEVRKKEYVTQILISGQISLIELKRIYHMIKGDKT